MRARGVTILPARRRGARRNGATGSRGLLKASPPPPVAALLAPYLNAVGPHDADGVPASYPGSPAIAQALLRADDRIALCEAHPEEREKLIAALGHDHRLSIVGTDGYVALNAYLPPKERRGPRPDRPAVRGAGRTDPGRRGARTGASQVADRHLSRVAADPRARGRRALPQQRRRPRRARTFCGSNSTSAPRPVGAHGQRPLTPRGPPDRQPAARAFRRGAAADALARRRCSARDGRSGHVCEWLTPPK